MRCILCCGSTVHDRPFSFDDILDCMFVRARVDFAFKISIFKRISNQLIVYCKYILRGVIFDDAPLM